MRRNPARPAPVIVAPLLAAAALFAACGSSNAERPYVDGGRGPAVETPTTPTTPPAGAVDAAPPDLTPPSPVPTPAPDGGSPTPGTAPDAAPPPDAANACTPQRPPACDAPRPAAPARRPFRGFGAGLVTSGPPRHRGHDLFFAVGEPQWLIAKIAYSAFDTDLVGEEVDIFLLRDCGTTWEKLGTAITTNDGEHAPAAGVSDSGGRVYFRIPAGKTLGPGRHRVVFFVAGDGTFVEQFVEVLNPGSAVAVVDVDGTLTTSEAAEFGALLIGQTPESQPDAARALDVLVGRGYRPYYLTARPEWLTERTREFLAERGFPAGILETTTGGTGALGADAVKFKTEAMERIKAQGLTIGYAIGNTETDADAYAAAQVAPPNHRAYLRYTDDEHGGRRFDAWADLLGDLARLPAGCR